MRTKLDARVTYENPNTALRTVELSEETAEAVEAWLRGQGLEPHEVIRKYRVNSKGFVTFKCGVGYAVVDADLLGGNGDGRAERRFEDETNSYIFIR